MLAPEEFFIKVTAVRTPLLTIVRVASSVLVIVLLTLLVMPAVFEGMATPRALLVLLLGLLAPGRIAAGLLITPCGIVAVTLVLIAEYVIRGRDLLEPFLCLATSPIE